MFDTIFEDTMKVIKGWKPKEPSKTENQYRDDLMDVLREGLNQRPLYSLVTPKRVSITKEAGRGLCDIAVDKRKIGIELKKDLKEKGKSEIDRLYGRIGDYKKEYEDIIIVLVGKTDGETLDRVKDIIADISREGGMFGLQQEPRIRVIDKGFKSGGKGGSRKSDSGFGYEFPKV